MVWAQTKQHEDDRWLQARLDFVVASLPLAIILNPIWAALLFVPFGGDFDVFGHVPREIVFAVVALHLFNSLVANALRRWAITRAPAPAKLLRTLIALQLWIASCWAVGSIACWVEGNAANNTLITLIIVANMWALVVTRGHHSLLFAAGLFPMMAILWLRAFASEGAAVPLLLFVIPIFSAYAWFMGASSRDRVDQLLRARFDLEDMARSLATARAEAVAKTAEAEAASASKSAFVANMSHELRTPMNAILGFAEVIECQAVGGDVPEQYRDYAKDIRESGAHLLSLINDMLDVAKIEAGKMEIDPHLLDARESIESAVRLVKQRADAKGQSVAVNVDPRTRLCADERALKQILINLVSNAVKFSPDGAKIVVGCAPGPGGSTRLTVDDTGPGVPEEKLKKLFQPFSRVDNRYDRSANGTGLGLALVGGLVALHSGRVWVENKPSGGLVATVEFRPANAQAAA